MQNTMVVCSGGMDSITLAYKVAKKNKLSHILTFDYGQRHVKEIHFARNCAIDLNVSFILINMLNIGRKFTGTALTDNIDIPNGCYTKEKMKITMVPNRNVIMLSIAYGLAATHKLKYVALAVHNGDHFVYPDCRPEFIKSFIKMQKLALKGYADIDIYAPYINLSKADIVKDAQLLGVNHIKSWSCYKGEDLHCGKCSTCIERKEAFHIANLNDPTIYLDKSM